MVIYLVYDKNGFVIEAFSSAEKAENYIMTNNSYYGCIADSEFQNFIEAFYVK